MPDEKKGVRPSMSEKNAKVHTQVESGYSQGAAALFKKLWKNDMVRLGGILLIITAITAMLLSLVNEITLEPIAVLKEQALTESLEQVFKDADGFDLMDMTVEAPVTAVYDAKKGGETVGYCVRVAPKGFGGEIDMIVGISPDNTVVGIQILSMSETPGLGTRAYENDFVSQYTGKGLTIEAVKSESPKDDEISAISGATITSKAVTAGVNAALNAAQALQ